MAKRLLFIEDLYDFYANKYQRSTHFDYSKTGEPLTVQVHGKVNFAKSSDDTEGLQPVHLQACHTELNLNGSNISEDVMSKALPSFSNRPILGYIHEVNGQYEFYKHNMHEEDGEIIYDEVPIGIIPESCNAQLVYDEDKKKTYCEVDGYIFEEYSKASEILAREEECAVSVELSIRSLSYNAKDKYLDIEDFFFSGVTILGKTPEGNDVMPGMANSNIKLADFSAKNNSMFENMKSKMIELQDRLSKLETACFNNTEQNSVHENQKEGGKDENMKFEELLAKYNKTVEDITFDYSEMSEEELTAKFEELFGEDDTNTNGDNSDEPSNDEGDGVDSDNNDDSDNSDGEDNQNFEKLIRTYEISHEDVRYALYSLLETVESADDEWYFINAVYDDHFTYENWNGDKIYGQKYSKDGDNVAFDGERYNLHRELLTDSEFAELQSMRSNYEALVEYKANAEKNELHAQREVILSDEKYSVLSENEAFSELQKNMDNYSLEDLEKEAKVIFADHVASVGTFALNNDENKQTSKKLFGNPNIKKSKSSRYGDLFRK